jgi:hypothetical protein
MHYVDLRPMGLRPQGGTIRGYISENGNYLMEIANTCEASPKLLALAAMAPEFEEFLQLLDTPLANMLAKQWRDLELKLHEKLYEKKEAEFNANNS